jgi:DNA helicase-2/ATP-dependent DNA helicase PcrA
MSRIIEMIINGNPEKGIEPYDDCYLVCIGDGDQSIYGFRGTDSDNCIKFRPKYSVNGAEDEVRITSMSINRRCKSEILNQAKVIIESVQNRIEKPVRYLTEGGTVTVKHYNSPENQLLQVIEDLTAYKDLSKTCICYRNNASSIYLAMELFDRNIPFDVLRGTKPLEDFYTSNILNVISMINNSYSLDLARDNLYKVLPKIAGCYNKKIIYNTFTDYLKKISTNPDIDRKRFFDFTFNGSENVLSFNRAMAILRKANAAMKRNAPMSTYMPEVLDLLYTNYISGLLKTVLSTSITPEYIKFINRYFSQGISYEDFDKQMRNKKKQLEENKDKGLKLTTMHGLKGLEFDNVIVIDLDDTIYPGRELASRNLTERQAVKIELEARRLLYVTVTRAKDNLILYFNQNCPTRYYEFFVNNSNLTEKYSKCSNNSYFVQESQTVEMMNKVNSIEEEFVFEEDLTGDSNAELTSNFSKPAPAPADAVDDLDFDDLFDSVDTAPEPPKKPSSVIDTSLNERDIMPGVKSILDILGMKE